MSPINNFRVLYVPPNKENTFAAGDTIQGKVTFTLTEDTTIKCLYVKAKGDARVHWRENHGTGKNRRRRSHTAHKRYYKAKEILVTEIKDGTVLPRGDHCYKFKLQIPRENIPPSFKGLHGKIVHVLQAKMSRSWHISSKSTRDLNFVWRTVLPSVESPQAGSVDKKVGTFSKGQVNLYGSVNKKICSPGETLHVTAKVINKSSKEMWIKYAIEQKTVYRAHAHAKIGTGTVCKIVGQRIEPGFEGDVLCPVTIPRDTPLSIHNCEIINVEFYLKVYLDISFALDPEVLLPLIIAVPGAAMGQYGQHGFPGTAGATGGPGFSDFPPPFPGPCAAAGPTNAYPYPPAGPMPYPNMPSGGFYNPVPGYSSQMPQQNVPYGYPAAPVMPYPVHPQASTTNAQFPNDMTPPSYTSIYPPVVSETEKDKKTQL